MPQWYGGSALNPDDQIAPPEQWCAQWRRTQRWFARVATLREQATERDLDANDMDTILAFFQNCYHLRDWLSAARPDLTSHLDALVRNHFEMGACRDICNGFKHKTLTRPTHDADFNVFREYDHFDVFAGSTTNPTKHCFGFADGTDVRKFDCFELAEKCIELWSNFLRHNSLSGGSGTGFTTKRKD